MNFYLNHTTYSATNNTTTYSYALEVSDPSVLEVGVTRLTVSGMAGILSQGDALMWRNAGYTDTTASWVFANDSQPWRTKYAYFDVVASGVATRGTIGYAVAGEEGQTGTAEGPVLVGAPETYSVSGTVYLDNDRIGGAYDSSIHAPLRDVTVWLIDADGKVVGITVTCLKIDELGVGYIGNYCFCGVPPGDYTVVVPTSVTTPAGEVYPTCGTEASVSVLDAPVRQVDFGYHQSAVQQPASVEVLGYVFFDVNRNGEMDDFEMPFDGITVTLSGAASQTEVTDGDGLADFGSHSDGEYVMAVTDGGAYGLFDYWYATTPGSYGFTIDSETESPVVRYFGYYPEIDEITDGLDDGEITGNNRTIGFWKHNVTRAIAGATKGIQVTREELLGYLSSVEDLGPCDDPYDFGSDPLAKALWYLHPPMSGNSPLAKLDRQLLAAELNWVSGFNSSMPELERAMLWWAEWVRNYDPGSAGALASLIDEWNNLGNGGSGGPATGPGPSRLKHVSNTVGNGGSRGKK